MIQAFEDLVYSCRSGVCNSCAGHCTQDATANEGKASFAVRAWNPRIFI
jgi:hypothetical protein